MGDPATLNEAAIDVHFMMQRLEELQRERERIDAQIEALAREDDGLLARIRGCHEERERIERRKLELEGEVPELEARRDALEDEQQALVRTRDGYDAEYTDLYARLDKSVDDVVEPAPAPALAAVDADRLVEVGPASVPLARPAPWRTTLIVVPDPDAPPVVAPAKPARWWTATHGMILFAVGLVALVTWGAIAAWPDDPPAPSASIDPKEGLEMVRAALVPASAEPAPAAVVAAPTEPEVAPAPVKRRAKAKRSRVESKARPAKKTKSERP